MRLLLHSACYRLTPWSWLIVGALFVGNYSLGFGQATVTLATGQSTSSVSNATTATFNEVTPTSFYGTGGTVLAPTSTYTSPTSANGTFTIAGVSLYNAVTGTPGSFVTGSSSGQYGTPTGDTTTYLSLGGARAGALTLTFSKGGATYFGLDWASPDTYNSVKLTFANGTTATYTPGTTNGGFNLTASTPTNPNDTFVNFLATSSNAITQVQLSSTSAAFELDNIAYIAVPEPATWLAGVALVVAATWFGLRRRVPLARPAGV